jgi:hypothetical protein
MIFSCMDIRYFDHSHISTTLSSSSLLTLISFLSPNSPLSTFVSFFKKNLNSSYERNHYDICVWVCFIIFNIMNSSYTFFPYKWYDFILLYGGIDQQWEPRYPIFWRMVALLPPNRYQNCIQLLQEQGGYLQGAEEWDMDSYCYAVVDINQN